MRSNGGSRPADRRSVVARPAPWNVVCFSGVDWDYNRQRPQWVMTALAERGARVLYVDHLGIRLPRPSDARRVARRLLRWARTSFRAPGQVRPGIRRDAPLVLPVDRPAVARWLARRTLARRLRRRIGRRRPLVVWTYSPLPVIADVAAALDADVLVYDWADDASEHVLFGTKSQRRRIAAWEDAMLRRADVVLVASAELLRRRGSPNPRTHVVPHGAPRLRGRRSPVPVEVESLARPRIGYVGTVSEWVDLDLLAKLADARPSWSFVLVGPVRARAEALRSRSNVLVVGSRPHDEMSGFLRGFDVGLIPYRVAPATEAASPVKLHEYLAHGLPVVSTDLPEVRRFVPRVRVATGTEGFLHAIEAALGGGRQPPAPGTPWEHRVDEMVGHVEEALGAP